MGPARTMEVAGEGQAKAVAAGVVASTVAVAVIRMGEVATTESMAPRRLLQLADRTEYERRADGCACSSWDICGRCMAVLPATRQAGR